jgi:hypothetical protein
MGGTASEHVGRCCSPEQARLRRPRSGSPTAWPTMPWNRPTASNQSRLVPALRRCAAAHAATALRSQRGPPAGAAPDRYSLLLFMPMRDRCSVRPPTNTTQLPVAATRRGEWWWWWGGPRRGNGGEGAQTQTRAPMRWPVAPATSQAGGKVQLGGSAAAPGHLPATAWPRRGGGGGPSSCSCVHCAGPSPSSPRSDQSSFVTPGGRQGGA